MQRGEEMQSDKAAADKRSAFTHDRMIPLPNRCAKGELLPSLFAASSGASRILVLDHRRNLVSLPQRCRRAKHNPPQPLTVS